MNIFVSGSMEGSPKTTTNIVEDGLLKYLGLGNTFLVGDASGVDYITQKILARKNERVVVYFMNNEPRNLYAPPKAKQPEKQPVEVPDGESPVGRDYWAIKDRLMAEDCDIGLVFWNGRSKGTKNNIDRLKHLNKPYKILGVK